MNFSNEFRKIKTSFSKVKEDMNFLSNKIYENYDEFMGHHLKLVKEVNLISTNLKENLEKIKKISKDKFDEKSLFNLKFDIKELKKIIGGIQLKHNKLQKSIDIIKNSKDISSKEKTQIKFKINKNEKSIEKLEEKYKSSELEIYLLKERLLEKDVELKQIKDINKHLFNTMTELTKVEIEMFSNNK